MKETFDDLLREVILFPLLIYCTLRPLSPGLCSLSTPSEFSEILFFFDDINS